MARTQSPIIQLVRIAPLGLDLQVRLDLEDGEVGLGIGADQPRRHVVAGTQPDHDLVGVLDDVVVGDDVALRLVDDHARAQLGAAKPTASCGCRRPRQAGNPSPPAAELERLDVDHGRRHGGRRHAEQLRSPSDDPLPCPASPGPPTPPATARPPRHSRSARRRRAPHRRSSAARQSTKSTSKKPRRTGGVVGRGGGSSKPKSCGSNEAIALLSPTPDRRARSIAPQSQRPVHRSIHIKNARSFWAPGRAKSTRSKWLVAQWLVG